MYIHVPFCVRRCSYCDFAVTATREPPEIAWLDSIVAEAEAHCRREAWSGPFDVGTVYVGGGTPSLLGRGVMAEVTRRLAPWIRWSAGSVEWTVEANPESFTPDLAEDWRRAGVGRVSLGAQTFHEPALRWMGRMHGVEGPVRAVTAARAAGIENVSIDLMFGLPARLGRDWTTDLDRTLALEPEHISLYGLTAEPATPLGRWVAAGREQLADEERYREEYLEAADRLAREGYVQYEVSNFARPGLESRHNCAYWEGAPYLGLGPGAHSSLPPRRFWNTRDWAAYRARLAAGESTIDGEETVAPEMAVLERLWLGLRQAGGVTGLTPGQLRVAEIWGRQGWAELSRDRVRLTPEGWLLLDRLVVELESAAA